MIAIMNEYFLIKQRNMEEELACVDETAPIWKYYQQEEDAIMDICMENFITCFLQGKSLVIETPVSTWKIITNGRKKSMFLYNRNEMEKGVIDDPNAMIPNYHSQSCRRNTIVEYLEYIIAHDFYREKNPVKYSVKNKANSQKGTKRHKKEMKKAKRREKRHETKRVMELIEQLGQENIDSNLPSTDS